MSGGRAKRETESEGVSRSLVTSISVESKHQTDDRRQVKSSHYSKTNTNETSLAENDKENVRVFANHFKKLLNNHKPIDTTVIDDIDLREVMEDLDDPLFGQSPFAPYRNLPMTNHPVSTAFPQMPSSLCQRKICATTSTSSQSSGRTKSTLRNGMKDKLSQ